MTRGKAPDFSDPKYVARREAKLRRVLEFAGAEDFVLLIAQAHRGDAEPLLDHIRSRPLTSQQDRDDLDWFLSAALLPKKKGRTRNTQKRVRAALKAVGLVRAMQEKYLQKHSRRNVPLVETTALIKAAIRKDARLDIDDVDYIRGLLKNPARALQRSSPRE